MFPHNAYHARNLALIAEEIQKKIKDNFKNSLEIKYLNIDSLHGEGIGQELSKLGLREHEMFISSLFQSRKKIKAIICMNDWSTIAKPIILIANILNIPTFGVVEGVQDFKDVYDYGRKRYPYTRVKYKLLTGEYDSTFFKDNRKAVVGIARIEKLVNGYRSPPKDEFNVLINLNFTYGVYTEFAQSWMNDTITACEKAKVNYRITQHHSDHTICPEEKVSKAPIYDLLYSSHILVSRFSTCLLEAMALKRPVIYFDNFGEEIDKFKDSLGAYPIATNVEELTNSIVEIKNDYGLFQEKTQTFFSRHVSFNSEISSAKRSAEYIIKSIKENGSITLKERIRYFVEEIKRILQVYNQK